MHDNTSGGFTAANNGVTNNGVYGDVGDLISGNRASSRGGSGGSPRNGSGSNWSGARNPALSNNSGLFGSSDDGGNATAAAAQQQAALAGLDIGLGGFVLGLGSPSLGGMPNGLSMAQLAQLNGMNGLNPFNMNMLGMANLSAMGISPEVQLLAAQVRLLLAAQIAAAGGRLAGLGLGGGLGGFAGMQDGGGMGGAQRGPGRSGGRSPGLSANGKSGSSAAGGNNGAGGGAKKDEEDFDPAVLNDVAGWLRSLRLHKYTPNFEGMSWKEMVLMDVQALEAQGVAALGARRKVLKTFEVVRRKMGIDDPTAPSSPPPPSGAPARQYMTLLFKKQHDPYLFVCSAFFLLVLVLIRTCVSYLISRETCSRVLILSSYVRMAGGGPVVVVVVGASLIRFVCSSRSGSRRFLVPAHTHIQFPSSFSSSYFVSFCI